MMAPFDPDPEIVGKLEEFKFFIFFLKSNNFFEALISVIFLLLKFFLIQNKNFVNATPS